MTHEQEVAPSPIGRRRALGWLSAVALTGVLNDLRRSDAGGSSSLTMEPPSPACRPREALFPHGTTVSQNPPLHQQVNHVLFYGQSLPYGYQATGRLADPVRSALMFDRSVRTDGAPSRRTFDELCEIQQGKAGETPASGFAMMFAQLCQTRLGRDPDRGGDILSSRLLFSDPAEGVTPIAGLVPGSIPFARLRSDVAAAAHICEMRHLSYDVLAAIWWQGQSDEGARTPAGTYRESLRSIQRAIQALAPGEHTRAPPTILVQIGTLGGAPVDGSMRPGIALAHLDIVRQEEAFGGSLAEHWLRYRMADIHYPPRSMRIAGAYLCLDLWDWLIEGHRPRPVAPRRNARGESLSRRQGRVAAIPFDLPGGGPLVIDHDRFPDLPFGGIQIRSADGQHIALEDVRAEHDLLIVTAKAPIAAGATVTGGWDGESFYHQLALRDTRGDSVVFDPLSLAHPMHRPGWIFEETLA